jgi:hypothetical protein
VDSLWSIEFDILNALNYAVNALVSVLLRGPVLLMFLQIGTAAHVRTEAWPASSGWGINIRHDGLISQLWHDVWRRSLSRVGDGGVGAFISQLRVTAGFACWPLPRGLDRQGTKVPITSISEFFRLTSQPQTLFFSSSFVRPLNRSVLVEPRMVD